MAIQESLPAPVWVDTLAALGNAASDLANEPRLAVDTESNSLHAYREQVCLVQVSTSKTDFLVDPLAIQDLGPLGGLFSNPNIEKIFHAAEYDLICLRRDFGFYVNNLFDTMHASRILGYPAVGLDKLLADKFGVTLDKRHQKADWAARPLTRDQIHYARLDTHYLLDLRDLLQVELMAAGRWPLALEDFQRACAVEPPRVRSSAEFIRRFSGRKAITTRELTVLNELCLWRERAAEALNRPLYKILTDDVLLSIAHASPTQKVDLAGAGVSEKQIRLWGGELLAAVRNGLNLPLVQRNESKPRDEALVARLEKLKRWRKMAAEEIGVESDIVLPRPYLVALAESAPRNSSELAAILETSPFRLERYGGQILTVLGG